MSRRKLWTGTRPAALDGRLQVVPYRPLRRSLLVVSLLLVLASAGALGYWLGSGSAVPQPQLAEAEVRIHELTRDLVEARLVQTVETQTARALQGTLSGLRMELAALKDEVAFYKSLMTPGGVKQGLQIAEFELVQVGADNDYRYHILLTQGAVRRNWLEGKLELQIFGQQAGADGGISEEVLPLTVLAPADDYPLRFRFRYFQDLVGTLTLPEGFMPRTIQITASLGDKGANDVDRTFDWVVRAG